MEVRCVLSDLPKSFQDTDGDGVGDLRGIISRLDYLESLGIDGIWLSPVCASRQVDNGYDISDYCAVDPMFGTMADMEELIAEAKKRGISIIFDLVLNHCSDQHPWFLEALKGADNPYSDYFIWRDGSFTLLLPEDPHIFAYTRDTEQEHLLVVCNFTDKTLHLDAPEAFRGAEVLLANYTEASESLRPYESVMLYYKD